MEWQIHCDQLVGQEVKEEVVAYFNARSGIYLEVLRKVIHFGGESWFPCRELNMGPPEFELPVLTT